MSWQLSIDPQSNGKKIIVARWEGSEKFRSELDPRLPSSCDRYRRNLANVCPAVDTDPEMIEQLNGEFARLTEEMRRGNSMKATVSKRLLAGYCPFPVDVFPRPIAEFIRQGAESLGCDASYFSLPFLAAASAAIGNSRRILVKDGWFEPAVMWTALLVPSGGGKSPAFRAVLAPTFRRQAELLEMHRRECEEYKAEQREWKQTEHDDSDDKPEPPPPAEHYVVSDTTTEGLAVRLINSPRGLLLAVDELAGWLLNLNAYKQKGGDKQTYLTMYDAATVKIDRKNAIPPIIMIPRAFVAICGGCQPGVFRRIIGQEDFDAGLMARFLFAMPPVKPAHWIDKGISEDATRGLAQVLDRLRALNMERDNQSGGLRPIDLPLSPGAKAAFITYYNSSGEEQAAADEKMAATLAKLRGAAARLALVLHLTAVAAGELGAMPGMVDEASMKSAIVLARWFAGEASRLFETWSESEEERQQRELVELIRDMGGRVSARDLYQRRRRYRNRAELAWRDLEALVDAGLGEWHHPRPGPQGGKPTEVFVLSDHINGVNVNDTPVFDSDHRGTADVDAADITQRNSGERGGQRSQASKRTVVSGREPGTGTHHSKA